jgi:predicted metallo-beta-lactamase superfamily hydrolase
MAVKRAKKLKQKDFDNVKIIQQRISLADSETIKLGELKVELSKKILQVISGASSETINKEIGKLELYIDKHKASLVSFIKATDQQNVELAKDLQNKYGEGTINPDKGTFLPSQL